MVSGPRVQHPPTSSAALRLRPVRAGDGPSLRRACFPERRAVEVEQMVAAAEAGRRLCLLAEWEGEVAGSGGLIPWRRGGEIVDLVVAPGLRRRGIGRALVNALLREARSRGYLTVEVGADQDNEAAIALYEGAGFCHRRTVRLGVAGEMRVLIYLVQRL